MPLYEYTCNNCNYIETVLCNYVDTPEIFCQACVIVKLDRTITGTSNFIFKGDGTHDKGFVRHGGWHAKKD